MAASWVPNLALWYGLNAVFVHTYKAATVDTDATCLTSVQFALGGLLTLCLDLPPATAWGKCWRPAVLLWCGKLLNNVGYARLSVLDAMLLKATEPLFSVVFGAYLFHKLRAR